MHSKGRDSHHKTCCMWQNIGGVKILGIALHMYISHVSAGYQCASDILHALRAHLYACNTDNQ